MAIVLGPTTPPTLACLVFRWFQDPDLAHALPGRRRRRPAARHRGAGDRGLARARGSDRLARQAMAGPWRPRRPRRRAALRRLGGHDGPVRLFARLAARPGGMVAGAALALPGRPAAILVGRALAGPAGDAGRADVDHARGRARDDRRRDRPGRRLPREREPAAAAPGRRRARSALRAAPRAPDRVPVRGPGAVPVAWPRRRLARGDLDPSPVRPPLRVFDTRRSLSQSRCALRAHRARARQAALAGLAEDQAGDAAPPPSDRYRRGLRGQRRAVPPHAVRRRRPLRHARDRDPEPGRRRRSSDCRGVRLRARSVALHRLRAGLAATAWRFRHRRALRVGD